MQDKLPVDPNFVMKLRKTIGVCGRKQVQGRDLLELEKTVFCKGKAELPVDVAKNRDAIEKIKKELGRAGASDVEAIYAHVSRRISRCENNTSEHALKALSKGHDICTYKSEGSKMLYIQILRK